MYKNVERSGRPAADGITGRELALVCFYAVNLGIFFLLGWLYGFLEHRAGHHVSDAPGTLESCAHATTVYMPRALCAHVLDA